MCPLSPMRGPLKRMGSAGFGEESQAANRGQHSHGLVPAHFIASSKATGTHQRASAPFSSVNSAVLSLDIIRATREPCGRRRAEEVSWRSTVFCCPPTSKPGYKGSLVGGAQEL